jgi:hypothetical protein
MQWPWEYLMKFKGANRHETDEVTAPAQKQIAESEERLSRINRILLEARHAEVIIQRRKGT